ncbi:MAG TPA: hypothetical protein VF020_05020, partial [Chthoniobacterales bacterium]
MNYANCNRVESVRNFGSIAFDSLRDVRSPVLVLMLNWLFYRPISGKRLEEGVANPWQEYWGDTYAPELKQRLLKPLLDDLEKEGMLGSLIVDIGSGAHPVSRLLAARPGRKRVCIDIAADNGESVDELRLRLDAEKIGQLNRLSFRKALLRVCVFLKIDLRTDAEIQRADTVLIADTLNYVDFRKVLSGLTNYLKPSGRIIILNLPYRGNQSLFSDLGLKDTRQLYPFFEEQGFAIERKAFPKR